MNTLPISPPPHLVLRLRDTVPGERAHFALVRLRGDATGPIVRRALGMAARTTPPPRLHRSVRMPLDPALVSLHHEDVTRHVKDVLVLAAFAQVENGLPGRLTLGDGVIGEGLSPDHADVELFRSNGRLRFSFEVDGTSVRTTATSVGLLACAALWMATPEEEAEALERLARLDAMLALRVIERGVELYRIGAQRTLGARLSEASLAGLLRHDDSEVRLRTLALLRQARSVS